MPSKPPSPIETWNAVVTGLILAKKSFKVHQDLMETRPNLEVLPIEAQQRLRYAFHRSSDFARFMLAFINHWRVSGGLEEQLIPTKEKKDGRSK
jgi:hypothetical protein